MEWIIAHWHIMFLVISLVGLILLGSMYVCRNLFYIQREYRYHQILKAIKSLNKHPHTFGAENIVEEVHKNKGLVSLDNCITDLLVLGDKNYIFNEDGRIILTHRGDEFLQSLEQR